MCFVGKSEPGWEKTVRRHELEMTRHGVEVGAGGVGRRIFAVFRRRAIESGGKLSGTIAPSG